MFRFPAVDEMPSDKIKDWSSQRDQICAEISQRFCPLKILLKTKDDPEMLTAWIEHHRQIVGCDGLIIFDNMSSDVKVGAIYDRYGSELSIYRYSEFHNLIHHTEYFPSLYVALRNSCNNFVFLDTDEHLRLYDGIDRFLSDSTIISFLADRKRTNIFPGTWLQNITGYTDHFSLHATPGPLRHGLKWGKPIISTASGFAGMINHNTQIQHGLYEGSLTTNFFVLHLSRVSTQQRVNANLRKLRSYKAIGSECTLESFLAIDMDDLKSEQVKMYAREIHEIIDTKPSEPSLPRGGWIQVSQEGYLVCSESWQNKALENFLSNPHEYTSELFAA